MHVYMWYCTVPYYTSSWCTIQYLLTAPVHITYISTVPTALILLLISTIHSYLDPFTLPSHDTVTTSLALLLIPCSFNSSLATLFPIHPLSHYLAFLYCLSSLTGVKVPPSPLYFFYASCLPILHASPCNLSSALCWILYFPLPVTHPSSPATPPSTPSPQCLIPASVLLIPYPQLLIL